MVFPRGMVDKAEVWQGSLALGIRKPSKRSGPEARPNGLTGGGLPRLILLWHPHINCVTLLWP